MCFFRKKKRERERREEELRQRVMLQMTDDDEGVTLGFAGNRDLMTGKIDLMSQGDDMMPGNRNFSSSANETTVTQFDIPQEDEEKTFQMLFVPETPVAEAVVLTNKNNPNIRYSANIGNGLLIGKNQASCAIAIANDSAVSREHCLIVAEGEDVFVIDRQSTNGTFVNGKRITDKTIIHTGDVLKIGREEYEITIR